MGIKSLGDAISIEKFLYFLIAATADDSNFVMFSRLCDN